MTAEHVQDIRARRAAGESVNSIAKLHNAHPSYIRQILSKQIWKDVPDLTITAELSPEAAAAREERVRRAREAYKPAEKAKQDRGEANETLIARMIRGQALDNNEAMDVITQLGGKRHGAEVKTFIDNANDKITVKKEPLARKLQWARSNRATLHTIIVDDRDVFAKHLFSGNKYYYARGSGSFRRSTMIPVKDAKDLQALMQMTTAQLRREFRKRVLGL